MTYRKANTGWHGVPRRQIKWIPTIAADRCTGCGLCVTSCYRGVLAFDYETDQAVVVTPRMCVVGCTTCAGLCPEDAVSLPARSYLQQLIKGKKVLQQSRDALGNQREKYDVKLRYGQKQRGG